MITTVYITAPKMSDVAKLKGQGNAAELCVLIEKNGQYDRHADVMEAVAQAALDLNQPEAVKRLSAVVGNNKMSLKTRLGIVRQFKQHNQVVSQAGDFAVKGQVPEELRLVHNGKQACIQMLKGSISQEIDRHEIRKHEDRNQFIRAGGSQKAFRTAISEPTELADGDAFLLCTDGFWDMCWRMKWWSI